MTKLGQVEIVADNLIFLTGCLVDSKVFPNAEQCIYVLSFKL